MNDPLLWLRRSARTGLLLAAPLTSVVGGCIAPPENVGSVFETEGSTTSVDASSTTYASESTTTSPILDLPAETGAIDPTAGCEKVDFLFVVDTSASMDEEQPNLVASVPVFLEQIEQTVATDYRILVVDHDAGPTFCEIYNDDPGAQCEQWCADSCPLGCDCWCGAGAIFPDPAPEAKCAEVEPGVCDLVLGSGIVADAYGNSCGVTGSDRFIDQDQPSLLETFSCMTALSLSGQDVETPIDAMTSALGEQARAGGCNEGFLRDDALLVITIITDTDDEASAGGPTQWKDMLLELKGASDDVGAASDRVVLLSIINDGDQPGATCSAGQTAPRLRELTESMPRGFSGSVCADDYSPFFAQALAVVDTACSEFVPPG